MYLNHEEEKQLRGVLKAFVEEWGPEHVIISVPKGWDQYAQESQRNLGRVRIEFVTLDTVGIRVQYELVRVSYDVRLHAL